MDIEDFYSVMNSNYAGTCERLGGKERLKRYLSIMLEDKSFENLKEAFCKGDCDNAFIAVHTMKGMCLNMGISKPMKPILDLTEKLRAGIMDENVREKFEIVVKEYEELTNTMKLVCR